MVYLNFIALIMLLGCSSQKNKNVQWQETIGVLETRGQMDWIHYNVDNISYKSRYYLRCYGETNGEKNIMRYNIANPEEIEIDYWEKVFEKSEKTIFLKVEITKVGHAGLFSNHGFIHFTLYGSTYKFDKEQILPANERKIYPDLKKGQFYLAECDINNIKRVVVHLDKPLQVDMYTIAQPL